jgi:hypothetical protein
MQRAVRVLALGAAAQDHGVAGFQAQRAGIRGHIGAALVDDADDAERHDHALDTQTVRPFPPFRHGTDGIRQGAHRLKARGDRLDARGIEAQPIQARGAQIACSRGRKIPRVGGKNAAALAAHRSRSRAERRVFLRRAGARQQRGRRKRGAPEPLHHLAQLLRVHGGL